LTGAAQHFDEVIVAGEYAGQLARPFMRSTQFIDELVATGRGIPDPRKAGFTLFQVPGGFRNASGTWQLSIDMQTKAIQYFNFVRPK
jgi:hypothetical protein